MTRDDLLAAAGPSVDPGRWLGIFDELMTRAGARFSRAEPRRRARAFVLGLLAELPRKNCWRSPGMPGTGLRTGCSTCCPGPGGTPAGSATTCAVTSWSSWVIPARCWWRMRRGT